jgi:diguanylate cyclase (GGDEF)-like protein
MCLSSVSQTLSVSTAATKDTPGTITTAREAHNLTDQQAKRALPIHLHGVITYFDPDFGTGQPAIFIHDKTGGIFIEMKCKPTCKEAAQLFVGAKVDVRGVSVPGGFGPIVGSQQIRVLGRAPLPQKPPRVSLAILKTGVEDAQWVEVEGSIHRVVEYPQSVTLLLEMLDGPIGITMIRDPGATYSNLVDAQVRIDANAAPTMNSDGQMIGVHLQAPNLSTLHVVEAAPSDPFAHSAIPIGGLLQWGHYSTPMHRVHLRGTVTLQWPGSMLCIRDATRGICARTTQATPVAAGDVVDMAGFVETDNNAPTVTDAVFRVAGNNHPVAPQPTSKTEILVGGSGSELIQIDGQLIGYDLTSSDATLQLSAGDTLFTASLPKSLAGDQENAWKIGSRLRVTGICQVSVIDVQNNVRGGVAVTKSFRVLMRSPADVTVLEGPSWWSAAHALILLGLALTVSLFVLSWVVILRRQVELQANKLRESEEKFRHLAQHDSLTGLSSRMVLEDQLKDAMRGNRYHRDGLAVMMLDLDKFKEVNDSFGHQAGDEVLRVSAQRLRDAVRSSDVVVRLGGDEFVVLLSEIRDPKAAEMIASTVVSSLSLPVPFKGIEIPISISVGVGTSFAGKTDAESLLQQADTALYHAKNHGRHCFKVFTPGLESSPERRVKADERATTPTV